MSLLRILRDGKMPIGSLAFSSSPGAQWPTYLWAPDSALVITELRRGELMELPKLEGCHGKLRLKLAGCLAVCAAAANLLFLISCPSAFAARQHAFAIKVVTSEDDQFWTNSVLDFFFTTKTVHKLLAARRAVLRNFNLNGLFSRLNS